MAGDPMWGDSTVPENTSGGMIVGSCVPAPLYYTPPYTIVQWGCQLCHCNACAHPHPVAPRPIQEIVKELRERILEVREAKKELAGLVADMKFILGEDV